MLRMSTWDAWRLKIVLIYSLTTWVKCRPFESQPCQRVKLFGIRKQIVCFSGRVSSHFQDIGNFKAIACLEQQIRWCVAQGLSQWWWSVFNLILLEMRVIYTSVTSVKCIWVLMSIVNVGPLLLWTNSGTWENTVCALTSIVCGRPASSTWVRDVEDARWSLKRSLRMWCKKLKDKRLKRTDNDN